MTSDEIEQVNQAAPPIRRLSGGDAAVIVGLLVFILAWVGGWIWGLVATTDAADYENMKWYESLLIVLIIGGPALWASNMIKHMIGKED